jgi:phosphopantetheinyl transferase (holo-ACP synthase)
MRAATTDAPASPALVIEAHGRRSAGQARALAASVHAALTRGAPAVIVLCAAGEPILRAREQLRSLGAALHATAERLHARHSRSATDGLAAWAASCAGPIGVDVQCAPSTLDDALLDAALDARERAWLATQPTRERAFAQLWAAKEAALKAFGVGLAWSPASVATLPVAAGWRALRVHALGRAWLSHLDPPGARSIALAVALNAGHVAAPV